MFELKTVRHTPGEKNPLTVDFAVDGKSFVIECSAAQLNTFAKFRQLVADSRGIWLQSDFYAGRSRRVRWEGDVGSAFAAGAAEAKPQSS